MEEPQIGLLLVEELNNKVIICWLYCYPINPTSIFNLPISFSMTRYIVCATRYYKELQMGGKCIVVNCGQLTQTSVKLVVDNLSDSHACMVICIGY